MTPIYSVPSISVPQRRRYSKEHSPIKTVTASSFTVTEHRHGEVGYRMNVFTF
ncbi:MAG: hypothetical protein LBC74_11870 [Planctomycetaceae bacterium]|nr:hypothetical protein [Planctomycetaceae bacterium]